ncbi:hypothetical protein [Pseudarthrobacter sp. S9]|uniref:hypothetical protein n=1 Tax=Pseudarthrobacter sp. S9 TaxID=3418421 RepID=UPI003D083FAE
MTENQWPQDGTYAPSQSTRQAPGAQSITPPPRTAASTTETVKDEAGDVAGQAADSARNVAETAKTEVANVASEVKSSARDLLEQARSDLTDQAGTQQQKVAAGLRSISEELHSMAVASDQPGVASDLVRQAAERSSSVASWLDDRDPGSLLEEVKSFARRRPGAFLLLAAGAGVLAGRLSRSLSDGVPASASTTASGPVTPPPGTAASERFVPAAGMAVPPPPVQLPGPDATTAGYAGGSAAPGNETAMPAGTPAGTYPPAPPDSNQPAEDPWSADRMADDPTGHGQPADDPLIRDRSRDRGSDDPLAGHDVAEAEYPFGTGPDSGGPR